MSVSLLLVSLVTPSRVYEVYMCNTVMLYVVVLCYMLCRCSSDTSTVGWEELHFNLKTPNPMDCYIYQ